MNDVPDEKQPLPTRGPGHEAALADAAKDYSVLGWEAEPIFLGHDPLTGEIVAKVRKRTTQIEGYSKAFGVAIRLGSLIDVDLDHPRAHELVLDMMPRPPWAFGYGDTPSHLLYPGDKEVQPISLAAPRTWVTSGSTRSVLIEMRTGRQRVTMPPSIKARGDRVQWIESCCYAVREDVPQPANAVDTDQVKANVLRLGIATMILADPSQMEGNHDFRLAWAGELAKQGIPIGVVRSMGIVFDLRGHGDYDDWDQVTDTTFDRLERAEPVKRHPDEEVQRALRAWIGKFGKPRKQTSNGKDRPDGEKPQVDLDQELDRVVNHISGIVASTPLDEQEIFRSGPAYVVVSHPATPGRPYAINREPKAPLLALMLARRISFVNGKEKTIAHPARHVVESWMSCPDSRVPEFRGEWYGPLLRRNGTVICEHGYDEETRLICSGWDYAHLLPHDPKRSDAVAAVERLARFVDGGQWVSPIDFVSWLSHVLTIALRPTIDGNVPVFLYNATKEGSGKTTLAQLAGWIGGGCSPRDSKIDPPRDARGSLADEELGRRIGKHTERPCAVIDNLRGILESESLESAVTSGVITVRKLYIGPVDVPFRTVLAITGNGLGIGPDWTRRVVPISLQSSPRVDRGRDLLEEAKASPSYRIDALTIAIAYLRHVAGGGQVPPVSTMKSFQEWSRVVAGCIAWLFEANGGTIDLVKEIRDTSQSMNPDLEESIAFLDAIELWMEKIGAESFTADEFAEAILSRSHVDTLRTWREYIDRRKGSAPVRSIGARLARLSDTQREVRKIRTRTGNKWHVARINAPKET